MKPAEAADAILFVSFGGPDKREDILPFLETVTRGRGIPRERLAGVAAHYEHIGGRSPINEITRRQAEALRVALAKAGDRRPVYLGQRNWHPFLEEALAKMRDDGVRRATGFITAPYRSEASLERYVQAVEAAREKIGAGAPTIEFVGPWFDHPSFIDAIAARVREKEFPTDAEWVFTAHAIPCAMAKESAYVSELRETASLVAAKLGVKDWRLAYTSRSGDPRSAWLEPDISKVIAADAARGVRDMVLIPIGFVADHVEVLYDLDVEAKAAADAAGVRLHRCGTVGEHPSFIAMIADVVRMGAPVGGEISLYSESTRFRDGRVERKAGKESPVCYCFPGEPNPPCSRPAPSAGHRPSA
jgi:ferrochelatase